MDPSSSLGWLSESPERPNHSSPDLGPFGRELLGEKDEDPEGDSNSNFKDDRSSTSANDAPISNHTEDCTPSSNCINKGPSPDPLSSSEPPFRERNRRHLYAKLVKMHEEIQSLKAEIRYRSSKSELQFGLLKCDAQLVNCELRMIKQEILVLNIELWELLSVLRGPKAFPSRDHASTSRTFNLLPPTNDPNLETRSLLNDEDKRSTNGKQKGGEYDPAPSSNTRSRDGANPIATDDQNETSNGLARSSSSSFPIKKEHLEATDTLSNLSKSSRKVISDTDPSDPLVGQSRFPTTMAGSSRLGNNPSKSLGRSLRGVMDISNIIEDLDTPPESYADREDLGNHDPSAEPSRGNAKSCFKPNSIAQSTDGMTEPQIVMRGHRRLRSALPDAGDRHRTIIIRDSSPASMSPRKKRQEPSTARNSEEGSWHRFAAEQALVSLLSRSELTGNLLVPQVLYPDKIKVRKIPEKTSKLSERYMQKWTRREVVYLERRLLTPVGTGRKGVVLKVTSIMQRNPRRLRGDMLELPGISNHQRRWGYA